MAQKEKVVTARVKKPKTAAQRAKTEANIKAEPWKKAFGPVGYAMGAVITGVVGKGIRASVTVDGTLPGEMAGNRTDTESSVGSRLVAADGPRDAGWNCP